MAYATGIEPNTPANVKHVTPGTQRLLLAGTGTFNGYTHKECIAVELPCPVGQRWPSHAPATFQDIKVYPFRVMRSGRMLSSYRVPTGSEGSFGPLSCLALFCFLFIGVDTCSASRVVGMSSGPKAALPRPRFCPSSPATKSDAGSVILEEASVKCLCPLSAAAQVRREGAFRLAGSWTGRGSAETEALEWRRKLARTRDTALQLMNRWRSYAS
jgi:hypothetical protein